jgi:hypothetical protein
MNIKQLILQIFNQKILEITPYTKSMQNDIIAISTYSAKDGEKPNRVKYFNFIINDEDEEEQNYAEKQNNEREPTVYQHIKQRNHVASTDQAEQHEILVKVVDRLDSRHNIITKQTGLSNASKYNYEQIQFDPIMASLIHAGEEQATLGQQNLYVSFCVYGRIDVTSRLERTPLGLSVKIKDPLKTRDRPAVLLYDDKTKSRLANRGGFHKGKLMTLNNKHKISNSLAADTVSNLPASIDFSANQH